MNTGRAAEHPGRSGSLLTAPDLPVRHRAHASHLENLALGVLCIGEAEGLVALAILAGMLGLSELGWRSDLRRARRAAAEQHARELLDRRP